MHTNMTVLDPIGDLIIILEDPNDEELQADIVLNPPDDQELVAPNVLGPSEGKRKMNAKERRRMRRRDLLKNEKPNTVTTDSEIVHEEGPSSPRLEESVNTLEGLILARNEDRPEYAKDNATPSVNTDGSNEPHSLGSSETEKDDEQNAVWFRVSSSHLRLASGQVRRRLSSAYHSTVKHRLELEDGTTCDVLRTEQWDANAFLIFLNIVHGHNRQVPDSVSTDTLAKLAILVDYYECHERVEVFARPWMEALKADLPKTFGKPAILWLAISWVFMEGNVFRKMTEMVLKHSKCPFEADTLALPPMLLANLKSKRQRAMRKMLESVIRLQTDLEEGKRGCTDECCCMLLGSIIKERKKHKVGDVWSVKPFDGRSLEESKQVVMRFQTPRWFLQPKKYNGGAHDCTLVELLQPDIDKIWRSLDGFELEDYLPLYEYSTTITAI